MAAEGWVALLAAVVLPPVGWGIALLLDTRRRVERMGVTLHGENGNNGLNGDVKKFRRRLHKLEGGQATLAAVMRLKVEQEDEDEEEEA